MALSALDQPDPPRGYAALRYGSLPELGFPQAAAALQVHGDQLMPAAAADDLVAPHVIGERERSTRLGRDRLVLDRELEAAELLPVVGEQREHLGVTVALDAHGDRA